MLTLTGGEPFNKKELLFDLIVEAKKRNMIVFVNTSASLICQDDFDSLMRASADGYLVSFMSYRENIHNTLAQTDSYERTLKGMRTLVEARQNVSVNMVCSKLNYKDVRKTAKLAESIGAFCFSAAPMMAALSNPGYLKMRLNKEELRSVLEDLLWVRNNTELITTTLEALPYCAFDIKELHRYRDILSHSYCGAGMTDIAVSPMGDIRPCIMGPNP